jgi:hypothetical protein
VEEVGHEDVTSGALVCPRPFLRLCLPPAHHEVSNFVPLQLSAMLLCSPQPRNSASCRPWTATSETVSHNKPFLFKLFLLGICHQSLTDMLSNKYLFNSPTCS